MNIEFQTNVQQHSTSMSDVRSRLWRSMSDVRCSFPSSAIDVRCSMFVPGFGVRCSMFDVRCSMFDVRFLHRPQVGRATPNPAVRRRQLPENVKITTPPALGICLKQCNAQISPDAVAPPQPQEIMVFIFRPPTPCACAIHTDVL
ncbi:MAG: hypothetical protein ACYC4U_13095 [Pirellulaceae bacterium]